MILSLSISLIAKLLRFELKTRYNIILVFIAFNVFYAINDYKVFFRGIPHTLIISFYSIFVLTMKKILISIGKRTLRLNP
jgi:hypothetical protein